MAALLASALPWTSGWVVVDTGSTDGTQETIRRFFEDYKILEQKQVIVEDFLGAEDAIRILDEALDLYRKLRRGEVTRK